jgi:hypothetical protein
MTLDILLDVLGAHLAALQSSGWPQPSGPSLGPAIYLDEADTQALLAELTRLKHSPHVSTEFAAVRVAAPPERAGAN